MSSLGGKCIQTPFYPQNEEEKIKIDHQNITGDLGSWKLAQETENEKNKVRLIRGES